MFDREILVAFEPSTCCRRVPTCRRVDIRADCFNGSYARSKLGTRADLIGPYDQCGAKAMGQDELRIISKRAVDLNERISATR
jgi:hypothetical protein